jgi:hypothetical protein
MAPAGCQLIDMQVVKHYKTRSLHILHISYTSHLVAIPYHKHSLQKNKLDASNLLIACFTWLMGATLKSDSYLCKATTVILGLQKTCCKSDDNYSGRNWHPQSRVHGTSHASAKPISWMRSCKVGLGHFDPTMPRHQEVHKKKLATKTSKAHNKHVVFYSWNTSTQISSSNTTKGFRSIVNNIFPTEVNKKAKI